MKKNNKKILGFISVVMFSLLLVACSNWKKDEVIERFTIELYDEEKHLLNSTGSNLTLSGRNFNTQRLNSNIWEYGYYISDRPEIYVEYERSEDFTLDALEIRDEKNPGIFAILDPQQNTVNDRNGYSIETIAKREQDGESNLWSFRAKITVPEINSFGEFEYSVEKIKIRLNSGQALDIKLDEVDGYSSVYLNIGDNDGWDYIDTRLRQSGEEVFTYYTYGRDISRFDIRIDSYLIWADIIIEEPYIWRTFFLVGIKEKENSNKEKLFDIEKIDEGGGEYFVVKYLGNPLDENSEALNSLVIEIGIFDNEGNMLDSKEYPLKISMGSHND